MIIDKMKYEAKLIETTGFWQTSDKANAGVIRACTELCEDKYNQCELSARYKGGTLLASSNYYTANGILIVNDPNASNYEVCCRKCWKQWEVSQQPTYGEKN